MTDFFLLKAFI